MRARVNGRPVGTAHVRTYGPQIRVNGNPVGSLMRLDLSATARPNGLTYARSGAWFLQTSASATASVAADTWGTQNTGNGAELVVTGGLTNTVNAPRVYTNGNAAVGNWSAGTGTITAGVQNGPDGATLTADRCVASTAQLGPYMDLGVAGVQLCISCWGRTETGTASWHSLVSNSAGTVYMTDTSNASPTWGRRFLVNAATRYVLPVEGRPSGGLSAAAQDIDVDLVTIWTGTHDAPGTLTTYGASYLTVVGSTVVTPNGYFDVDLGNVASALEAPASATADRMIFRVSATTFVMLRAADDKIVYTIGGVEVYASGASPFAASAALGAIRVWHRADSCGLTIPGTTVATAYTGAAQAPIAVPATVALFSDGTTAASVFASTHRGPTYAGGGGLAVRARPV